MSMDEDHKLRARRQGNRLGIFVVVLGLVLLRIGLVNERYPNPIWVTVTASVGAALLVFGYPLARLWFWFS
jgi:hypothetical protein